MKIDDIVAAAQKIFDLITLAMNKFIQLRSQMGTIKGYAKKDSEKEKETLDENTHTIDEYTRPVDKECEAEDARTDARTVHAPASETDRQDP